MKTLLSAALLLLFGCSPGLAQSPANPPPGSVWTYQGPTVGPGWVGGTGVVNVVANFGADNTCTTDAAPAFRNMAAAASSKYLLVPPGCYLFGSTVPSGYPAINPANVRFHDQHDFVLDMRGAQFRTTTAGSYSGMIQFDGSGPGAATRFQVLGGYFVGNHSGWTATEESCAFVPMNVTDFRFEGQVFDGNWGGMGAAFCGNFQSNGAYRDIYAHNVGACFDFAFISHVTFDNIRGYGADADGTTGTNKVGMKCFSFIYDVPNVSSNFLGIPDNADITISNSSATNFIMGYYLASGRDYTLTGNHWYSNPGCTSSVGTCATWASFIDNSAINTLAGYGGVIMYDGNGSVGHPVVGFVSQGESYVDNGNTTQHGGALYISTHLLTNGTDDLTDYVMNSTARGNNNTVIDVSAGSANKLLNVNFAPLCTDDATIQVNCIGLNVIQVKNPLAPSAGEVVAFNNLRGAAQSFASTIQGDGAAYRSSGLSGNAGGAAVSLSGCGSAPTLNGNNIAGFIQVGSGTNGDVCTLNFSAPWVNQPACLASSNQPTRPVYTSGVSPTQVSFSGVSSLSPGDFIVYQCTGFQ